jgi:hypothetical protein
MGGRLNTVTGGATMQSQLSSVSMLKHNIEPVGPIDIHVDEFPSQSAMKGINCNKKGSVDT